jgi:hypothetical protein
MLRAFAAVSLAALVCATAGSAGSSLENAARHYAGQVLGDPHPRLTRIETVRVVDGHRMAVIQMRGRFTFISLGPAGGRFHSHYAVMEIALPSRDIAGYWGSSAGEIAAITGARRASPLLRIFPDFFNERVLCSIPRGGTSSGTVAGTCSTEVVPGQRHGWIRQIEFAERWPLSQRSGTRNMSGWIVTLDRHGHVRSVHRTGKTPPQLWR